MTILNKTKKLIFIISAFLIFASCSFAQNTNENCFEVKYLDFFDLDKVGDIKWSDEDINELLKIDYKEEFTGTRFYIPMLAYFLKDFHPDCNKSIDNERFNKIASLYFKITLQDISLVKNKSVEEKVIFIRDDFYRLVKIDELLPLMKFTFDDGPIYGEIPKNAPKKKYLETVNTDFGQLSIVESNEKVFLIATDKKNKTIWSRILKGENPVRYLKNLKFDKNPIENTSLATIIHFYSEGERLNLYLKPDGKFMYYYHSW